MDFFGKNEDGRLDVVLLVDCSQSPGSGSAPLPKRCLSRSSPTGFSGNDPMRHFRLLSGIVLLMAVAVGRADDKPAPPSLRDDLARLRGSWQMAGPPRGSHLYLEFGKTAN